MKRSITVLITLLTSLLLLFVPASAEAMTEFDYTDDITEEGCPIYYFPEISLKLPVNWRGKVMAIKGEKGTSFYQTASYEKYREEGMEEGGFLFMLGASVNHSFSELPSFEYLGFCEESAMNYYLMLPSDYPAYNDPAIRAEYDAMYSQIDYVVENADIYSEDKSSDSGIENDGRAGNVENTGKIESTGKVGSIGSIGDKGPEDGTWPDAAEAPVPSFAANTIENAAEGAEEEAEDAGWTPQEVRYQFEHSMLPRYFYEVPEDMMRVMEENGVYALWEVTALENGADPAYSEEDYKEHWYEAQDGTTVLQIDMPEPDANTLCWRIYMLYNVRTGEAGYYTVEYDEFLTESSFICMWDEDRIHTVLEGAPILDRNSDSYEEELQEEAEKIANLAGIPEGLRTFNI